MEERTIARHGLILGKFLPPHRGHLHLIQEALRRVDTLTLLVCSLEREPIPGALRYEWMRELVPNARVMHVTDENPQYPEEHPDFWSIWIKTIRDHEPSKIDVVFTSEDYGDELARRLDAVHECIDRERSVEPISGTAIRNDPMMHWEFIPEPVRPFFVRRIVLTGSECTGKTTLAPLLAAHHQTVWVPEYGREYVDALTRPLRFDDVEQIARGQIASEDRAARRANRLMILDTDLISTAVYSRHYFGEAPDWLDETIEARKGDLYLLSGIDVPWVADGMQRDRGDRREEMQQLFRDALREFDVRRVEIRGSVEERLRRAIEVYPRLSQPGPESNAG